MTSRFWNQTTWRMDVLSMKTHCIPLTQCGRVYHYFQFTHGETEDQRGKANTPRSHSKSCPRWDSNLGCLQTYACLTLGTNHVSPSQSSRTFPFSLAVISHCHDNDTPALVSYCCWNKPSQTWWLQTTQMHYSRGQKSDTDLTGLKSSSSGGSRGACASWPFPALRVCLQSTAPGSLLHLQSQQRSDGSVSP